MNATLQSLPPLVLARSSGREAMESTLVQRLRAAAELVDAGAVVLVDLEGSVLGTWGLEEEGAQRERLLDLLRLARRETALAASGKRSGGGVAAPQGLLDKCGWQGHCRVPLEGVGGRRGVLWALSASPRCWSERERRLLLELGGAALSETLLEEAVGTERRARVETEAREGRFRSLVEAAGEVILQVDASGRLLYANPAAERLLGVESGGLQGRNAFRFVAPEYRRWVHLAFARRLCAEALPSLEVACRTGDGRTLWLALSVQGLVGAEGSRIYHVVGRDVTDRKLAEESLRRTEERFRLLAEHSLAGTCIIQRERFLYANARFAQIFGYLNPEELQAECHFLDVVAPADRDLVRSRVGGRLSGEIQSAHYHFRGLRKDGSEVAIEVHGTRTEIDGVPALLCVILDVTERQRWNQERERLLESERYARSQAETARHRATFLADAAARMSASFSEPTALLDILGRICVPALADYAVVFACDEGQGLVRVAGTAQEEGLRERLEQARLCVPSVAEVESGGAWALPLLLTQPHLPEYARRMQEEHAALLGGGSILVLPLVGRGRLVGLLVLGHATVSGRQYGMADLELGGDLAERAAMLLDNLRLYREAERASKLRDQVLAIVSHDLRSPLSSVQMTVQTLLQHWPPKPQLIEPAREQLRVSLRAAGRMRRLIQDLLDVAQIESGTLAVAPQLAEPAHLLREAVLQYQPLMEEKGISLEEDLAAHLPLIRVDAERIQQVLGNLLDNAVRFTPPEGRIRLSVRSVEDEVRIEVRDNGPGIPESYYPRLFDRFWKARNGGKEGAGLGLSIVRGIMEAHGGRVWVESRVGLGTTFVLAFPLLREEGEAGVPLPE